MSAPEKLWVRTFKTGYKQATLSQQPFDPSPCGYDDAEYRRADLSQASVAAHVAAEVAKARAEDAAKIETLEARVVEACRIGDAALAQIGAKP